MDRLSNPARFPADAALGLAGAVVGGGLGYLAFGWLAGQGFYALALPGVLLGLGAAVLAKRRSMAMATVCGVVALALGVFSEWKHFPFAKDDSLDYFVAHLFDLRPFTLILIGLGGFGGFWFARPAASPLRAPSGETPPS
jgi:multisubunit Na+/H+ antiporter MnhB subunit